MIESRTMRSRRLLALLNYLYVLLVMFAYWNASQCSGCALASC
jgi:hypothetical protein